MKNLEIKIKVINENRGENSFYEYVKCESQSDPNFFRWLFEEEFDNDFDSSLSDEQKAEFKKWLNELEVDEKIEKYIVVEREGYNKLFITNRANFKKVNLCDCYESYGQKNGCYNAGCYSLDNSESNATNDCKINISAKFGIDQENIHLVRNSGEFIIELGEYGFNESEVNQFIAEWRKDNEFHTEATGWTYWDGSNNKTLVIKSELGEPTIEEIDEEEERKILSEFTGAIDVFQGAEASVETENYIFTTTRWASDPWLASVQEK